MDYLFEALLFLHFVGLSMGAASTIYSLVGLRVPATAGPPSPVSRIMPVIGRSGLAVLVVTGPLMLWLRYGGMQGLSVWFHIKMLFVLLVIVSVIMLSITVRRMLAGDASARGRLGTFIVMMAVGLFGAVLSAVLAFG